MRCWRKRAARHRGFGRARAAAVVEFAVVLPNTDLETGIDIAQRIRKTLKEKKLVRRATGETLSGITL